MAFGLGVLKLAPNVFWAMTLREIASIGGAVAGDARALDRGRFSELMRRFPDGDARK